MSAMDTLEGQIDQLMRNAELQWTERVFCNSLILRKLMSYLSMEHINSLRSLNSQINHEVLQSQGFKNRSLFVISEDSVKANVLAACDVNWKNVRMELYDGIGSVRSDKEKIRNLLENEVEFLNLTGDTENPVIGFLDVSYNEQKWPLLMDKCETLPVFRKLKSLQIHSYVLNAIKIRESPFLTEALFQDLTTLVLYFKKDLKLYNPKIETDNFAYIAENCKSLTEFIADRIFESHIDGSPLTKKSILTIMESNSSALTTLYATDEIIWSLREIADIKFPALKHFGLRCNSVNSGNAIGFLKNHLSIESLRIAVKPYLPYPVLKIIQEMSKGLKLLHVKSSQLGDNVPDAYTEEEFAELQNQPPNNLPNAWGFLKNMEHLESFSIISPLRNYFDGPLALYSQLWQDLPTTVKAVNIRGLHQDLIHQPVVPRLAYNNLTVLKLLHCRNSIDDEDVQFICTAMTSLVQLEFSDTLFISDIGITGLTKNENQEIISDSNISIKNLKGLKSLTIRNCPEITNNIVTALAFTFLTDLNLGNNPNLRVTPVFIDCLIFRNPMLKKVWVSDHEDLDIAEMEQRMTTNSSGRCTLQFVDDNWAVNDSDIDADDYDEYHDVENDSDISGGGYDPNRDENDFAFTDGEDSEDGFDMY